jgi:hypothetical protein
VYQAIIRLLPCLPAGQLARRPVRLRPALLLALLGLLLAPMSCGGSKAPSGGVGSTASGGQAAVTLEYTIKNSGKTAVKKAVWEISRHYPGGLTFFPTAEKPVAVPGPNVYAAFEPLPFTTDAGVAWFKYQKADWTKDSKGGANGAEGWAAHINCGAGLEKTCASGAKSIVMIKDWVDSLSEAPGEKEIEIFANAGHNYIEFEQQSEYQTIPAGGTLVWTMHWMLRTLPADIAPKPDNAALVDWVRSQIL